MSRDGVAFPTAAEREYVPNRRGWGVSSSPSTLKIREVSFVTGDHFYSVFARGETVAPGIVFPRFPPV